MNPNAGGQPEEDIVPSGDLTITTPEPSSAPDSNERERQMIQPESTEPLPCVYRFDGGEIIAAHRSLTLMRMPNCG